MKRIISVQEFKADLKNGLSDEDLMKKYGISEGGLRALLNEFLTAMSQGTSQIRLESKE